jgi:hypothetical protein
MQLQSPTPSAALYSSGPQLAHTAPKTEAQSIVKPTPLEQFAFGKDGLPKGKTVQDCINSSSCHVELQKRQVPRSKSLIWNLPEASRNDAQRGPPKTAPAPYG